MERLAPEQAASFFERAIEMHDHSGGAADDRVETMVLLGTAQRRAGIGLYRQTLTQAASEAKDVGHADLVGLAGVAASRGLWSSVGRYDEDRLQILDEALTLLPVEATPLRARLLVMLAAELLFHPERNRRFDLADQALALARTTSDADATFDVIAHRLLCTLTPATVESCCETPTSSPRWRGRAPTHIDLSWPLSFAMWLASMPASSTSSSQRCWRPTTSPGNSASRCCAGSYRPTSPASSSSPDASTRAEALATEAFSLGVEAGETDALTWYGAHLAIIRYEQRRLGEIIDLVAGQVAELPLLPAWKAFYTTALCELDRREEARAVLDELARDDFGEIPFDLFWLLTLCFASDVCAQLADTDRAPLLRRQLEPWAHLPAPGAVVSWGASIVTSASSRPR